MAWVPEEINFLPEGDSRVSYCQARVGMASPGPGIVDLVGVSNPLYDPFARRGLFATRTPDPTSGTVLLDGRLRDIAPAIISRRPNVTDVFAIGADETDGMMLTWANVGGTWSGPQRLEGPVGLLSRAAPCVVSWAAERLDVFGVTNPDPAPLGPRQLVHWWWYGGAVWSAHQLLESRLLDVSAAAVAPSVGRIDVFAVGADDLDGQIVRISFDGNWESQWPLPGQSRGLVGSGGPAAISISPDQIEVFAVSRDGDLLRWSGPDWHGPETLMGGLDPAGKPCVLSYRLPGDSFIHSPMVFVTRRPDGIAGPRRVARLYNAQGRGLEFQEDLLLWVNAFGPAAVLASSEWSLYLASGRDDGRISLTHTDVTYAPPRPPTLTATAVAPGHVRLNWSLEPVVVRVEIWFRNGIFGDQHTADINPPQNNYDLQILTPGGGQYCYFVRAFDARGGSAQSTIECVTLASRVNTMPIQAAQRMGANLGFEGQILVNPPKGDFQTHADHPVAVSWTSSNYGSIDAPEHHDHLTVYQYSDVPGEKETTVYDNEFDIPALSPGVAYPTSSDPIRLAQGRYRAVVVLDSRGEVHDLDRSNNELEYEFDIWP